MSTDKLLNKLMKIYGSDVSLQNVSTKIKSEFIDIYPDGASAYINGNRLIGIGVFFGVNDERNIGRLVTGSNNNQAEIIACIEGLKVVKGINYFVNVYTDSRLVDEFVEVNFIFVKGHSNIFGNMEADKLSKKMFNQ